MIMSLDTWSTADEYYTYDHTESNKLFDFITYFHHFTCYGLFLDSSRKCKYDWFRGL